MACTPKICELGCLHLKEMNNSRKGWGKFIESYVSIQEGEIFKMGWPVIYCIRTDTVVRKDIIVQIKTSMLWWAGYAAFVRD